MFKTVLLLCFLLLFEAEHYSKSYFVDSEKGSDNNSGISPAQPLQTMSAVQKLRLSPGDSVLFKRGSVWNENIIISFRGSINDPVTFTSYGSGELPVIDLLGKKATGVLLNNSQNVIVDGFNIKNIGKDSCNIKLQRSQNCIIRNCSLFVTARAGVFVETSTSCIIQNNSILTADDVIPNQSDGIYAQRNNGNIYDGNTIINRNKNVKEHSDCIQLYRETLAVVRNNYLEQKNDKRSNAQGLYSTMPEGVHTYYNNVIVAPFTKAHLMAFLLLKEGTGKVLVFNNTISGGQMNVFRTDSPDPVVKNNIFITSCNCSMVRFDTPLHASAEVDNNIYFSRSSKPVYYLNKEVTFNEWKAMGRESEGLETDPNLNKDFTPKEASPGINAGVDLSIIFKEDKAGLERIKTKRFDIGAYEFKEKSN